MLHHSSLYRGPRFERIHASCPSIAQGHMGATEKSVLRYGKIGTFIVERSPISRSRAHDKKGGTTNTFLEAFKSSFLYADLSVPL